MRRINCDVLVVGGGGAGVMAAYEATKFNVRVCIASKGKLQRSGATIMAPGAISAVDSRWQSNGDSYDLHMEDTLIGGAWINEQSKVKKMVEKSASLIMELERLGAYFQRNDQGDTFLLRKDGGHTLPRSVYLEDRVGREMVRTISGELRKRNVKLQEEVMILEIIQEQGQITGAIGIELNHCEPVIFQCKSLILATGGAGMVYANTDNPIDLTGDGYALALKAGAELKDMEFVQFYPIGLLYPLSLRGILGGIMYYSRLYNIKRERFMERYDPDRLEFSTRDIISQAILQEVREGRGTPGGGVYCDMTFHPAGFIEKMVPSLYKMYMNIGFDPSKDLLEVAPTCHFFMGGVKTDDNWEGGISGLYGAGEVVGGMHGGNRLSQNALAEVLVSGAEAGKNAAIKAGTTKTHYVDPKLVAKVTSKLEQLCNGKNGVTPIEQRKLLRKTMWEYAGVSRSQQLLKCAREKLDEIENTPIVIPNRSTYLNCEILTALENENLILTAKSIVEAALQRQESRGAHFRSDFPHEDNVNWRKNIIIRLDGRQLLSDCQPVEFKYKQPKVTT